MNELETLEGGSDEVVQWTRMCVSMRSWLCIKASGGAVSITRTGRASSAPSAVLPPWDESR